jgi:hypothetical protein
MEMIIEQPTLVNQKSSQPPQAYMHISACMVEMTSEYTENCQEPLHTHKPLFSVSCIRRILIRDNEKSRKNTSMESSNGAK